VPFSSLDSGDPLSSLLIRIEGRLVGRVFKKGKFFPARTMLGMVLAKEVRVTLFVGHRYYKLA
jgi:hypothetical protein